MPTKLPLYRRPAPLLFAAAVAVVMALSSTGIAASLVTNQAAARLGLERAWFAQVRVNPAQHKVVQWLLDKDQIFALTSAGTIQAFDAETGETVWTTEVGTGVAPAVGIAVNSNSVAMLDAGRLYLVDRADGHRLWSRRIDGAASAAPALGSNHVFVALLNGLVEGYRLDDLTAFVWQYQSVGHIFQSPTITDNVMSWPTDRGLLYVGQANGPSVLFRIETNEEIVVAPASQSPYLYVASLDGYLYSFHESTGNEQWRFATGYAIASPPAVIGEKVFVASEGPSLHAIDTLTGQLLWRVDGVTQFVALGAKHTYGVDRYGTLLVLDNESGDIAGRLATGAGRAALVNDQSDRIFLINDRGLVQCLHEIGADEPTWHRATKADEAPATSDEAATGSEGSGTKEPAPESNQAEDPATSPFEAESEPEDSGAFEF
ncbi:MAG: PQQ-binding-like beta-propeller repeat protein [Planctomycetes bacterium]|nr:PQQ-binding-like beta-propeller repeat protein [Planctomycetota bacterium]